MSPTIERLGIDCDLELTGELTPSVAAYQDGWAAETAELYGRFGYDVEVFGDAAAMRAEVDSPIYRGGAWVKDGGGVLDPAKLAIGLADAARRAGVHIYEGTPALSLMRRGRGADGRRRPGPGPTGRRVAVRIPAGARRRRARASSSAPAPTPPRSARSAATSRRSTTTR